MIGVGGGVDIHTAARYGASHITGVDLDPVTIESIRDVHGDLAQGFFDRDNIELVTSEGRHFVSRSRDLYDVIQITGADTLAASSSGAYVLAENYLYTSEALQSYLERLAPGGVLSIANGHWNSNEPRATGRMVSVARHALEASGVENPGEHVAVIDSKRMIANMLVKNEPISEAERSLLAAEAERLGFDVLLLGDKGHPVFLVLAYKKGEALQEFFDSLAFEVDAVTDDRPFFFRFWRWKDLLDKPELDPVHTTALGQLVLVVLLISLSALGAVFVLLPLVVFRRRGLTESGTATLGILGYVLALGLGFMLFEVSLLQRFIIYLGYPTHSLSVVMLSLLSFLGLGSFFPLGIRRAESLHEDLVPWAWAANGYASVTGTVLAVVLAMNIGFEGVWLTSLCIYAAGVAALLLSARSAGN